MRAMILEGLAGQLGKAVISRIGKEVTGKLLERQQNRAALERALKAALRATDQRHREVLGRYDVNVGFFEHEGADEIARVLLPGRGPDARRMARAYVGSLGGGQGALLSDPLVEP
jgi:hypothetical protein